MWSQVQASAAVAGRGCPLIRSKHAMCVTPDGHIFLYGGRSMANMALRDFWRFDPDQNQWEEIVPMATGDRTDKLAATNAARPPRRSTAYGSGHSSGLSSSPSSSSSSSSSSPAFPYESSGNNEPPPPLQEHTLLAVRNRLYLFGGEVGYSSDETPLWTFDLNTARWYKLGSASVQSSPSLLCSPLSSPTGTSTTTSRPLSRRGHTAVLYRDLMAIYGGYQDLKGSTSELWTFHLDSEEWNLEANGCSGSKTSSTTSPSPRHSHSAVVYGDEMFIYGGMTDLQIKGDFWRWNFKNKAWHRIKSGIKQPGELCGHSAIVVLDSMFIYGGERANGHGRAELWRYRFTSQHWEHLSVGGGGLAPGSRTRHVALANPMLPGTMGTTFYQWSPPVEPTPQIKPENIIKKRRQKSQSCQTIDETSFILSLNNDTQPAVDAASLEPKKSISLCFDSIEAEEIARLRFQSPESEEKTTDEEHQRARGKSASFRHRRPCVISPQETINKDCEHEEHQANIPTEPKASQLQTPPLPPPPPPIKLRPRRPQLSKQRPYSDYYGNNHKNNKMFYSQPTEEEPEDVPPEFKRRSVQESMSYYSLCFATPPAVPKMLSTFKPSNGSSNTNNTILSPPPPMPPLIEPATQTNNNNQKEEEEVQVAQCEPNQAVVVRREKASIIRQRMRRANLELNQLIASTSTDQGGNDSRLNSAYYSLSLDISPDFEKELRIPEDSPPSSSDSMERYGEPDSSQALAQQRRHPATDLDILDDYLEPEEMLEIVTTTDGCSGNYQVEISPTNRTNASSSSGTYPKTPAARKQQQQSKSNNGTTGISSAVSHSSSGYQSLVLRNGGGSSISNSSSFDQPHENLEYEEEEVGGVFLQSLHQQFERSMRLEQDKLTKRNETAATVQAAGKAENIPLKEFTQTVLSPPPMKPARHRWPPHVKHRKEEPEEVAPKVLPEEEEPPTPIPPARRSRSLERKGKTRQRPTAHVHHHHQQRWEPNIKEVIREVIVPSSPAFENVEVKKKKKTTKTKKSFISSITPSSLLSGGGHRTVAAGNRQLAMYVFGGKEEGATGVLNKQSIPVWKLYI